MDKSTNTKDTFFTKYKQIDYLSSAQSISLKGWLAICVLACHMIPASGIFKGSIINPLIASLGYLSVSTFFFLSGYGMMVQWEKRGEVYLNGFMRTRVFPHYVLNVFLIIIYGLFIVLSGGGLTIGAFLQSFAIGGTIVSNGWYMQVLLLFYLLWFIAAKYFSSSKKIFFTAIAFPVILYMVVGFLFLSSTWWESSLSFLLGIVWQRNKECIDRFVLKSNMRLGISLCFFALVFCVSFFFANVDMIPDNQLMNTLIRLIFKSLSSPAFVALALLICMCPLVKWFLARPISSFLGAVSLEIYVLQGIPLHIFRDNLDVGGGLMYILCVVLCTAVLVALARPLIRGIVAFAKCGHRMPRR